MVLASKSPRTANAPVVMEPRWSLDTKLYYQKRAAREGPFSASFPAVMVETGDSRVEVVPITETKPTLIDPRACQPRR